MCHKADTSQIVPFQEIIDSGISVKRINVKLGLDCHTQALSLINGLICVLGNRLKYETVNISTEIIIPNISMTPNRNYSMVTLYTDWTTSVS